MSSRVAEDKSGFNYVCGFNYVSIARLLVVSDLKPTIVVFPGSGGGAPNLNIFRKMDDDAAGTEVIEYPGWRRYIERDFSAEAWMMDLAIHITNRVPSGPIRIVGVSIGGHFGYAIAVRLQAA